MVELESSVRVPETILFQEVGGESVLLNLRTGLYFSLDEIGTRMWHAVVEEGSFRRALGILLEEYKVGKKRIEEDLLRLAEELVDHGLVELDVRPAG